jgi:digeranylgeranylglycerophospholipid reductase
MRDVLIVGAGPAGATAARYAAKAGLSVLILDQSPRDKIGDKTCGNALDTGVFRDIDIAPPKAAYYGLVKGIEVVSPDWKTVFRLEQLGESGMMLDRLEFGQYLLSLALNAGAELVDGFAVTGPVLNGGVAGVRGVHQKEKSRDEYRAKAVVEASGVGAVIRRNLGKSVDNSTDDDETMICHRQIRQIVEPITEYSRIYLDQEAAPGGYIWYFPMGDDLVNMGLGLAKGTTNPERAFERYASKIPKFAESKLVHAGSAVVPIRRPMSPSVHEGVIFTGDAGFTVNPLGGGGIAPSMQAGKMAAEALIQAAEKGDYSIKSLWAYCHKFNTTVGRIHASHDILRIFLQGLYNEDANFGMAKGVITQQDVMDVSSGRPLDLGLIGVITRLFAIAGKATLLTKLVRLRGLLSEADALYADFPNAPGPDFQAWRDRDLSLHKRAHELVGGPALAKARR